MEIAARGCRRVDAGLLKVGSSLFVLTTYRTLIMYFLVLVFFYNHKLDLFPHRITGETAPRVKMNVTSWQQVLHDIQPQDLDLGQTALKLLNHVFVLCLALYLRCDKVVFLMQLFIGGSWEARRRR